MKKIDFVVVGSGIAGMNAALVLADFGEVLLVTKGDLEESSTHFAQGGVAAVGEKSFRGAQSANDNYQSHVEDTLAAGGFQNKKKAVEFLVEHGFEAIQQLEELGVPFEKNGREYALGLEAAHRFPRVFHASDFTGQEITRALIKHVKKNSHIHVKENTFVVDLIVKNGECFGVQILEKNSQESENIFARAVILATGGLGHLFRWTTNPGVSTGDGIAIACRAGADVSNLEYIQFHPTVFNQPSQNHPGQFFLLSEALRGEGAWIVNERGERFIKKVDERGELASRDIVARAIFTEQKNGPIFLDIHHRGKKILQKRFPNIFAELIRRGFDLSVDRIPVTAAAHFSCGGITTDLYGRTSMKNLYAYGEVANSGVHGANRLASNSLLEGMVFSSRIGECVKELPNEVKILKRKTRKFTANTDPKLLLEISTEKENLRDLMWNNVGIIRTKKNLLKAQKKLKKMEKEIRENTARESLELKNMIQTAQLITDSALKNEKSLGAHYREN